MESMGSQIESFTNWAWFWLIVNYFLLSKIESLIKHQTVFMYNIFNRRDITFIGFIEQVLALR